MSKENKEPRTEVIVELVGKDGNVFNLIGLTSQALRREGYPDEAKEFNDGAHKKSSYDEVLKYIQEFVTIE